jgi:flagellar hook assembly protein FlgD
VPNPFNPSTGISFNLPENSNVHIEIYNVLGQKVDSINLKHLPSGKHTVLWDGSEYPSGVYLYKISAGKYSEIKKMTLLK